MEYLRGAKQEVECWRSLSANSSGISSQLQPNRYTHVNKGDGVALVALNLNPSANTTLSAVVATNDPPAHKIALLPARGVIRKVKFIWRVMPDSKELGVKS